MMDTSEPGLVPVVIVGGGASGTLLAWNLRRLHGVSSVVVDPGAEPGRGLAYSTPSMRNLLNVPARGMSADPEDDGHFLRWLADRGDEAAEPGRFVPRATYGRYLQHLWAEAAPIHVRASAVGCRRTANGFALELDTGSVILAERLVLACGHFAPPDPGGIDAGVWAAGRYHHDAWAADLLDRIGANDRVLLIGTGLTAIDVLLRLRENGARGQVLALSRHALLPDRHADCAPLAGPALLPGRTAPSALGFLRAFRSALEAGGDRRAVADSLRPVTNDLWQSLPVDEQRRFKRHLSRRWDVLRHRMAPEIAAEVQAELDAGTLRLVRGRITAIAPADGDAGNGLLVSARSEAHSRTISVDHVVNCTGPNLRYESADAPLLRVLLSAGVLQPGLNGAGLACSETGAAIDRNGRAADDLFALGPARQGTLLESVAIPETRQQARALADYLAASMVAPRRASA